MPVSWSKRDSKRRSLHAARMRAAERYTQVSAMARVLGEQLWLHRARECPRERDEPTACASDLHTAYFTATTLALEANAAYTRAENAYQDFVREDATLLQQA